MVTHRSGVDLLPGLDPQVWLGLEQVEQEPFPSLQHTALNQGEEDDLHYAEKIFILKHENVRPSVHL